MAADVLLITATFSSSAPFTRLTDTTERVEKYMEGLLSWLGDDRFEKIVMVKNCQTAVNADVFAGLAREYGKGIEFLTFTGSNKASYRGKGYGEGEIVAHALRFSRLLRESDSFVKITGKLYCPDTENYFSKQDKNQFFLIRETCTRTWPRRMVSALYRHQLFAPFLGRLRRDFRVPLRLIGAGAPGMIDTRFYQVQKKFYLQHLLSSYKRVQDFCNYYLEHAFFDDLRGQPMRPIEKAPFLIGTSGTDNFAQNEYPNEIRMKAKETARRLLARTVPE